MTHLVTGGTGFIGAYTIRDLLAKGETVVSFDFSFESPVMEDVLSRDEFEKVLQVRGDILDLPLLLNTVREHNVERIVHMASLLIPASNANPSLALRVNSEGTTNVLEVCRTMDIKRLVWASSILVFGPPELYGNKPISNDAPHHPTTVYGACKSLNEFMARYYFEKYGIDSIGFRFTDVYGVGRVRGTTSYTTKMIEMAAKGEPYIVPFGDDLVDWQFVEDVSRLILTASELSHKTKTRVFNTQGDVRRVVEGVNFLKQIAPQAKLQVDKGKLGLAWEYDTTPLREEIGFKPQYSMEAGIKRTYERFLKMSQSA